MFGINKGKDDKTEKAPKAFEDSYDEVIDELLSGEEDVNVGELLNNIVFEALQRNVSDVHIEPREDSMIVRFRIDGLLRDAIKIDKKVEQSLIFKIKVASRLRTDEHFAPQDGKIRFEFEGNRVDARISILPVTKGEKVVMRLLTQAGKSFALEDLGFQDRELDVIKRSYGKPYGMIVAAGPTGSGKTTTLYSILKILNSPEINITTIEDPVEYDLEGVNHVQVNKKADLTFATGLRSLLRQDPDVLMIGEIRDTETARIATNSAMTGHLVLSTIHTNDSVTTIPRLIDMGVEPFLVASTINVVVAQRLARRLCSECKVKSKVTKKGLDELQKLRPDLVELLKVGDEVYEAKGCEVCGDTGFKGRVGLYEVFEMNKQIREMIGQSANADQLREQAIKDGMELIIEDGIAKVHKGLTSIDEVARVTALKE